MTTITSNDAVTAAIGDALHRAVGHIRHAPKIVARMIGGRNPRTAKNWLEKRNAPGAAELIDLMREFDEVYDAVMELANRKQEWTEAERRQWETVKKLVKEMEP